MKTMKKMMAACLLAVAMPVAAQIGDVAPNDSIVPDTYTYAIKGQDTLKLDVYMDKSLKIEGKKPVFIYSFGGGWNSGSRKDGKFINSIAKRGFVGVNIDYRLGVKKANEAGMQPDSTNFDKYYGAAIDMAIEDLYDATTWLVNNAEKLGLDIEKFIISGGSAGAINSLTAEYYLCNEYELAQKHLPHGFSYAGVVAFAGGIWKSGIEDPVWKTAPCPIMMVHGDKDQLVAYNSAKVPTCNFSAFGSGFLSQQFDSLKFPYEFFMTKDADHVMAGLTDLRTALNWNYIDMVVGFINRQIFNGERVQVKTVEQSLDEPKSLEQWIKRLLEERMKEGQQ